MIEVDWFGNAVKAQELAAGVPGLEGQKGRASKVEGIPRFFPNRIDASMRDGMRKTRNEKRSNFA